MSLIKKDNDLIRIEVNDYHKFDKPSVKDKKSKSVLVCAIVLLLVAFMGTFTYC